MRVYEIAKLFNLQNKDLIKLLEDNGFTIKSHMSVLGQDALDFLDKKFKKPEEAKKAKEVIKPLEEKKSIEKEEKISQEEKKEPEVAEQKTEELVFVVEQMTLGELSEKIEKPVSDLILVLLKQGIVCTKNQLLPIPVVENIAKYYEYSLVYPEKKEAKKVVLVKHKEGPQERCPVVVVLGHVDHGKTTLLDFIRKTRLAQKEKGGITQHLGAYVAETAHGNIVFIDTPGHEAFSNIRGRGVKVADIAILIVAADDGVMPQTIEAIKKAKEAQVPIVVAINKVDKVNQARVDVVKNELTRYDLLPEEWGGDVLFLPISAKSGQGVDKLLEMIVLQAQMMDLRTDASKPASGFILESKIEKGLGPVATVICQQGMLRIGDFFAAGNAVGRVSSLTDSFGKKIKEVGSSIPVLVSGFNELSHAGDFFEVVSNDEFKKLKQGKSPITVPAAKLMTAEKSFRVIIKTDNTSSKEALLESIHKLLGEKVFIVFAGIGDISESDVILATNTNALIVGLHVKIEANTVAIAQKNIVHIMLFDIIYKLLEYLEQRLIKEKPVKLITKKIGDAIIRKVFHIKNVGVIAGAYVKEGRFTRDGKIIAWHGKKKIGEGHIKSLERDRKSVKEVHTGFEFAFLVEGIEDWQIDDHAECFVEVPE